MYAHVNIWPMSSEGATADNTSAREMAARLFEQPGFVSYTLIRTGEREFVAVTVFQTSDQLQAALQANTDFIRERIRPLAAGDQERREGAVLYHQTGRAPVGDA